MRQPDVNQETGSLTPLLEDLHDLLPPPGNGYADGCVDSYHRVPGYNPDTAADPWNHPHYASQNNYYHIAYPAGYSESHYTYYSAPLSSWSSAYVTTCSPPSSPTEQAPCPYNENPCLYCSPNIKFKKSSRTTPLVWRFLWRHLEEGSGLAKWIDRQRGIFEICDTTTIATLWGKEKRRPKMTYASMARGIRDCKRRGLFEQISPEEKGDLPKKKIFKFSKQVRCQIDQIPTCCYSQVSNYAFYQQS